MTDPVLSIEGLRVASAGGEIVRGADLEVRAEEIVGLFGESGCGKTTLALAVCGLLGRERVVTGGTVRLRDEEIVAREADRTDGIRGGAIGLVPQDPFSAFDPLRRVGPQIATALRLRRGASEEEAGRRILELLDDLGMPDPAAIVRKFPHELSGGQRQRALIAAALSTQPELVIADEPTSALDVIVQAQVLDTFTRLARELHVAVLLVTHDVGVMAESTDRVAAMYAGKIVEFGPTRAVLSSPRHQYVAGLLASLPSLAGDERRLRAIPGQPPSLPGPLYPCSFVPRCPAADELCRTVEPRYDWPAETGFACHHPVEPVGKAAG